VADFHNSMRLVQKLLKLGTPNMVSVGILPSRKKRGRR